MNVFIAAVSFVAGMIIKWSGSYATIPTGFVLCDGASDTPDLTDKFVVGAGSSYAKGDEGGATTHGHTLNNAVHNHYLGSGVDIAEGSGYSDASDNNIAAITVNNSANMPPYYALYYIMKT